MLNKWLAEGIAIVLFLVLLSGPVFGQTCSGFCTACTAYSAQGTCESHSTCSWDASDCGGTPSACSTWDGAESGCTNHGCNWNQGQQKCIGQPDVCSAYNTDESLCTTGGCTWDAADCSGTCTDCSTFSIQGNCEAQPGCSWGEAPDVECGNNTKESGETCDGTDLDLATCVSKGYTGGTLVCLSDCTAFDTSNCTGTPEEGECVTNCCGDRLCEESNDEDYGTCRVDCPSPANLFFTFYSPGEGQTFSRGERVLVKVGLKADSITPFSSAVEWFKVSSPGIFGTIDLFDDGEHDDGKAHDGVYAKSFLVRIDANAGEKTLTVEAKVVNTQQGTRRAFIVNPLLRIDFLTDKNSYVQGDLIEIKGFIKRGADGIGIPFDLSIAFDGNALFDWNGLSLEDGSYKASFQTTTISPAGEFVLGLSAADEFGNQGIFSKKINVFKPKPFSALSISLIDALKPAVERGERIKFTVNLLDEYGEFVKNAAINLVAPSGETIELEMAAGEFYTSIYTIPWDAPAGEQSFEVKALKKTAYSVQRGEESFAVEIKPSQINFELLEPKRVEFAAGEEVNFQLRLTYPSGEPVTEPVINASINNNPVSLTAVEKGIYAASYQISLSDSGGLVFSVAAEDQSANAGFEEYKLSVSGISWLYWVKMFPVTIGFFVFAVFLAIVVMTLVKNRRSSLSSLRKRKRELGALRKDVQNRYYKLNVIDRKTYNKLRGKYDTELGGVEQTIKELERKRARKGK